MALQRGPDIGGLRAAHPGDEPGQPALGVGVDTRHPPMFWFPRDCPRGCIWPVSTTTAGDRERFFSHSATTRIHVIEADWLDRCDGRSSVGELLAGWPEPARAARLAALATLVVEGLVHLLP